MGVTASTWPSSGLPRGGFSSSPGTIRQEAAPGGSGAWVVPARGGPPVDPDSSLALPLGTGAPPQDLPPFPSGPPPLPSLHTPPLRLHAEGRHGPGHVLLPLPGVPHPSQEALLQRPSPVGAQAGLRCHPSGRGKASPAGFFLSLTSRSRRFSGGTGGLPALPQGKETFLFLGLGNPQEHRRPAEGLCCWSPGTLLSLPDHRRGRGWGGTWWRASAGDSGKGPCLGYWPKREGGAWAGRSPWSTLLLRRVGLPCPGGYGPRDPVVTSRGTVMEEVGGGAVLAVDPHSVEMADAMERLVKEPLVGGALTSRPGEGEGVHLGENRL